MTTVKTTTVRIDDPLGYPERNVIARLRHMARDDMDRVAADAVRREAELVIARLRHAGKLGHDCPRRTF